MLDLPLPTCLIVDDHPALRHGVRLRLEMEGVAEVVGEAGSADEALVELQASAPDVLVVDFRLPGMNGLDLVEAIRERGMDMPVVLLTALADRRFVERAFAAGIDGYVAKDSDLDVLTSALRAVVDGRRFVDPSVAELLLDTASEQLSPREHQVLQLMSTGLQNKQIATRLTLGEDTVKTYVAGILRKLDATSRTQAVATALRAQMID